LDVVGRCNPYPSHNGGNEGGGGETHPGQCEEDGNYVDDGLWRALREVRVRRIVKRRLYEMFGLWSKKN
jgi:hypothetical protein